MRPFKHARVLTAAILAAIAIIGFTPKIQTPDAVPTCKPLCGVILRTSRKFTMDTTHASSQDPDIEFRDVPQHQKIAPITQAIEVIRMVVPLPLAPATRWRLKRLLSPPDSPDPLA